MMTNDSTTMMMPVTELQYYVPAAPQLRELLPHERPSLGMRAVYSQDRVRTFEGSAVISTESQIHRDSNASDYPHDVAHSEAHREKGTAAHEQSCRNPKCPCNKNQTSICNCGRECGHQCNREGHREGTRECGHEYAYECGRQCNHKGCTHRRESDATELRMRSVNDDPKSRRCRRCHTPLKGRGSYTGEHARTRMHGETHTKACRTSRSHACQHTHETVDRQRSHEGGRYSHGGHNVELRSRGGAKHDTGSKYASGSGANQEKKCAVCGACCHCRCHCEERRWVDVPSHTHTHTNTHTHMHGNTHANSDSKNHRRGSVESVEKYEVRERGTRQKMSDRQRSGRDARKCSHAQSGVLVADSQTRRSNDKGGDVAKGRVNGHTEADAHTQTHTHTQSPQSSAFHPMSPAQDSTTKKDVLLASTSAPVTNHQYFHFYPELPAKKMNPFTPRHPQQIVPFENNAAVHTSITTCDV